MNKVWYLFKIQLMATGNINKMLHENDPKKKTKVLGMSFLFLLIGMMFVLMSATYNGILLFNLLEWNMESLYLPLVMTLTSMILFLTTIYKVNGVLFSFKDYDLLMSLPIKTSYIIASRIIWLYSMNFLFLAIIMIPAGVLYSIMVQASIGFWIKYIIGLLCVPFIPIILGAIIGTIITVIASKSKHTNIISIVLSMAVVVAIFASTGTIGQATESALENMDVVGQMLEGFIQKVYPLALMYGNGVCSNQIGGLLVFIVISLLSFGIFIVILGRYFKQIQTRLATSGTHTVYKLGELKGTSPLMALYKKELRRYFSSSLYVMNTAIGSVLLLVFAISLCFFDMSEIESALGVSNIGIYVGQFAPIVVAFFMVLTCTTASAISLEGKNLWILHSSPIPIEKIFISKLLIQLTITVPAILVSGIIMIFTFQLDLVQSILVFVIPLIYSTLIGMVGLSMNLKYPKLDWTSEVQVVKQGAPVMLTMVIGLLSIVIPVGLVMVLPGIAQNMRLIILTVLLIGLTLGSYKYLNTKGVAYFKALS